MCLRRRKSTGIKVASNSANIKRRCQPHRRFNLTEGYRKEAKELGQLEKLRGTGKEQTKMESVC